MTTTATQGHTYMLGEKRVMAMTSGEFPRIYAIDLRRPWPLLPIGCVNATQLTPLPMTYFNGEVPR